MAITVITHQDFDNETYRDGTKWVIDDNEALHVIGPGGNLSSYNRGTWVSVRHCAEPEASEA